MASFSLQTLFKILTWPFFGLGLHKSCKKIPGVRIYVCRGEIRWYGLVYGHEHFIQFAAGGHLELVGLYLCAKIEVNAPDNNGDTALIGAARGGHIDVVRRLLAHPEININVRNHADESAWIAAIRAGHNAIDRLFEENDADDRDVVMWRARAKLEKKKIFSRNHFVLRCETGTLAEVQQFLDAGMDVNAQNDAGDPALMGAARRMEPEVARLLLARPGIEVNIRNLKQESPLLWAARLDNKETVDLLLATGAREEDLDRKVARWQLEQENLWSEEQFVRAVDRRKEKLVRKFLLAGIDPNARDGQDRTGLILAARNGCREMVELLLEQPEIDVNARANGEVSALLEAVSRDWGEIVDLLKQAHAEERDLEAKVARRRIEAQSYPYDAATFVRMARRGQKDMVGWFLEAGMNPDAANEVEDTPLIAASRAGYRAIVELLLEHGASVDAQNRFGRTALDEAREAGYEKIAELLLRHGGVAGTSDVTAVDRHEEVSDRAQQPSCTPLLEVVERRDLPALRELLDQGVDSTETDEDGNTPLALACAGGWNDGVALLLQDTGVDIDRINRNGDTPLMLAARAGWHETVELLLGHHHAPNLDAVNHDNETALFLAAREGRGLVVERLALAGAKPSIAPPGTSPLIEACDRGPLTSVHALLARGADLNLGVRYGFSPLLTADRAGRTSIVRLLKDQGATVGLEEIDLFHEACTGNAGGIGKLDLGQIAVDARDRRGRTPLMVAAERGFVEVVRLLLSADADPKASDREEITALMLAAGRGRTSVLRELLNVLDPDEKSGTEALLAAAENDHAQVVCLLVQPGSGAEIDGLPKGRVPLVVAASRGHLQVVRTLLKYHADLNKQTRAGTTALQAAILRGHEEVAQFLITAGASTGIKEANLLVAASRGNVGDVRRLLEADVPADPGVVDSIGRTPLMRACGNGHVLVVVALLEHFADKAKYAVLAKDLQGRTPLMWAAIGGDARIIRMLIDDHHAEVGVRSKRGRTALMEACRHGWLDAVRILLDNHEDDDHRKIAVNDEDQDGNTPLSEALMESEPKRRLEYKRIVEHLGKYKAERGREPAEFLAAAKARDLEKLKSLVSKIDVEKPRFSGKTALMLAAENDFVEGVRILLDTGARVATRSASSETALLLAARKGHSDVVKLLLDRGADCEASVDDGPTALLEATCKGHLDVVSELLRGGADPDRQDQSGWTPLMHAVHGAEEDKDTLVALLLGDGGGRMDIDRRDFDNRTALTIAHLKGEPSGIDETNVTTTLGNLTRIERRLIGHGARKGWNEAELLLAARTGDVVRIRPLIKKVDINVPDLEGNTALMLAFQKNDEGAAELLLDSGANVDTHNTSNRTVLMEAAKNKSRSLVDRILGAESKPDIDYQDDDGVTAILEAAREGASDIVVRLVEEGADVNLANRNAATPLTECSRYSDVQAIRALLGGGANACAYTRDRRTAILEAARHGHEEVLEVILTHVSSKLSGEFLKKRTVINAVDGSKCTALEWARRNGHEKCADLLENHGALTLEEANVVVYVTPKGDCFHEYDCGAIHIARDGGTLEKMFLEEARSKGLDLCIRCDPRIRSIDWNC